MSLHMQQEMTSIRHTTDSQKTKYSGGMTQDLSERLSTSAGEKLKVGKVDFEVLLLIPAESHKNYPPNNNLI